MEKNIVKLRGDIVSVPVFKKECNNIKNEKLSFILKCPTDTRHYALVPVSLWGILAINHRDRLTKGSDIRVEGALGTWNYVSSDGAKTKHWAVNAEHIDILSQKKKEI